MQSHGPLIFSIQLVSDDPFIELPYFSHQNSMLAVRLWRVGRSTWGIAQDDGSTGFDLLPNISPTFEWIRLAQRVPVRIHFDKVPEEIKLRVGTTASVLVMTGTSNDASKKKAVAVPKALQ